jgi:hypothetical protein
MQPRHSAIASTARGFGPCSSAPAKQVAGAEEQNFFHLSLPQAHSIRMDGLANQKKSAAGFSMSLKVIQ